MSRIPVAAAEWVAEPAASAPAATGWLVARLGRRTSGGRYLPEVDGLRFVSIALVVLYHLRGYLLVNGGAAGGGVPMRLVDMPVRACASREIARAVKTTVRWASMLSRSRWNTGRSARSGLVIRVPAWWIRPTPEANPSDEALDRTTQPSSAVRP
jgi:hypothetical protein